MGKGGGELQATVKRTKLQMRGARILMSREPLRRLGALGSRAPTALHPKASRAAFGVGGGSDGTSSISSAAGAAKRFWGLRAWRFRFWRTFGRGLSFPLAMLFTLRTALPFHKAHRCSQHNKS